MYPQDPLTKTKRPRSSTIPYLFKIFNLLSSYLLCFWNTNHKCSTKAKYVGRNANFKKKQSLHFFKRVLQGNIPQIHEKINGQNLLFFCCRWHWLHLLHLSANTEILATALPLSQSFVSLSSRRMNNSKRQGSLLFLFFLMIKTTVPQKEII